MANYDEDAGERNADAAGLAQCQTVAKQRECPQRNEQRPDRLQQQSVDRGGVLQAVIGHRVVSRETGEREQRHYCRMLADDRPIARDMARSERQQDHGGAGPADEGKRHRRHMPDNAAADNGVAGPEQRRQRQQQVRLVVQPASAARGTGSRHPWHERPFPSSTRRDCAAQELSCELAHDQCRGRMTGFAGLGSDKRPTARHIAGARLTANSLKYQ